jgi:hypothetical protein
MIAEDTSTLTRGARAVTARPLVQCAGQCTGPPRAQAGPFMFTTPSASRALLATLFGLFFSTGCAPAPRGAVAPASPTFAITVEGSGLEPRPLERRVVVFEADTMCTSLQARSVALEDASPEAAVREVMRSSALATLPITEPKVRVEARSALVDLRLAPGSQRSLHRLSHCEELALLGAIRLTLRANPEWGIAQVIFTDRGDLLAI